MSAEGARTESADWERLAPRWEDGRTVLCEPTRPVSEWLVEQLGPRPGQTVLELAAGTGETGFLAAPSLAPGGLLISSDRSPAMVEAARRGAAERGLGNVAFRVLDAVALELADGSLDGVISRFGYILKGEPRPPALGEVRRVLRAGGRLVFAVWAERSRNSWITVPADAMVERGLLDAPSAAELRLSERRNAQTIALLLEQAGLELQAIEEIPVSFRFADAEELWRFVSELRGPLSLALGRLEVTELALIRSATEARARSRAGGYELGGVSLCVLAT